MIAAIVLIASLGACCKASFDIQTYFTNDKETDIELKFYEAGKLKETLLIKAHSTEPKHDFLYSGDSILVFSNNILRETHHPYTNRNVKVDPLEIKYSDPGNLYNLSSYSTSSKPLSCNGRIDRHTYVFKD